MKATDRNRSFRYIKLKVKAKIKCKLGTAKMQDDGEQMCATGLDGSSPSSASATEESLETTTLQDERAPLKRKSDEELGSDQKRRLVTEETQSSDEAIWALSDEIQNAGSHGENGSEGKEICEPSEPERRVIISTFYYYFLFIITVF